MCRMKTVNLIAAPAGVNVKYGWCEVSNPVKPSTYQPVEGNLLNAVMVMWPDIAEAGLCQSLMETQMLHSWCWENKSS